jgi:molybdopterin molybdotransferase
VTTAPPAAALLSVEAARDAILASVPGPRLVERVKLDEAVGRVLAAPVVAAVTQPPWDNSAMDGYAVRAADLAGAGDDAPVRLAVTGRPARSSGSPRARRSRVGPTRSCRSS